MPSHFPAGVIDLSRPRHNLLLLKISRSLYGSSDIYDCVRGCWKLNKHKAEQADYILAVSQGIIVGVYQADKWFSTDNKPRAYFAFPWQYEYIEKGGSGRFGFEGHEAEAAIRDIYLNKEITALPNGKTVKGQNPICYAFKNIIWAEEAAAYPRRQTMREEKPQPEKRRKLFRRPAFLRFLL